jgi:hypothetical protein
MAAGSNIAVSFMRKKMSCRALLRKPWQLQLDADQGETSMRPRGEVAQIADRRPATEENPHLRCLATIAAAATCLYRSELR